MRALHAAAAGLVEDEGAALNHRVAASAGPDGGLADELEGLAARLRERAALGARPHEPGGGGAAQRDRADRERRLLAAVEAAMYAGDNPRARALAAETDGFAPSRGWTARSPTSRSATGRREEAELRLERAWEACGRTDALAARIAERRAFLAILRLQGAAAVEWARALARAAPGDGPDRAGRWRSGSTTRAGAPRRTRSCDEEARRGVPLTP